MRRNIVCRFLCVNFENKTFCFLSLFLLFLSSLNCFSQTAEAVSLELNKPIECKLSREAETQKYQINLAANQYAKIIVQQHEIDVTAQLFAPDGTAITTFDYEPRLNKKKKSISSLQTQAVTN